MTDRAVKAWIGRYPGQFLGDTQEEALQAALDEYGQDVTLEYFSGAVSRAGYEPQYSRSADGVDYWRLNLPDNPLGDKDTF